MASSSTRSSGPFWSGEGRAEGGDGTVEGGAVAETGGDDHPVARTGMDPGEGPAADLGTGADGVGPHRLDVGGDLPVPELAHEVVARQAHHHGHAIKLWAGRARREPRTQAPDRTPRRPPPRGRAPRGRVASPSHDGGITMVVSPIGPGRNTTEYGFDARRAHSFASGTESGAAGTAGLSPKIAKPQRPIVQRGSARSCAPSPRWRARAPGRDRHAVARATASGSEPATGLRSPGPIAPIPDRSRPPPPRMRLLSAPRLRR